MKKLIGLLSGLLILGSAHAEIISFDFTAKINLLQERAPFEYPGTDVLTSSKAGIVYNFGDIIHGHFDYDTSTGLGSYQPADGTTTLYQDYTSHNSLSAATSSAPILSPTTDPVLLQVHNEGPGGYNDYFSVNRVDYTANAMQISSVLFMDFNGQWLSNSAVPTAAQLNGASYSLFSATYYFNDNSGSLDLSAAIISLPPTAAVPEPASYVMLLVGLLALAAIARRRRHG